MDFNTIAVLHKADPAFIALRKDWITLAVSFLHLAFKRKHEVILPLDIFREQLDIYIESVNASLPDENQFRQSVNHYLDRWSREDDLIRIRANDDGYTVQLSPHAERILGWFEEMQRRGVIGTESRLLNIMTMLDDIVTQSTEDVETRLQQLYYRRTQLDAEIDRIESTQQVDSLSETQIHERLEHITSMATQLLRDFSLVEERFRDMARTIQKAQLDPERRRGEILGAALDANEQLESSDEGQSFHAFYELLTHPDQRDRFDSLIKQVFETPRLAALAGNNAVLQRLTSHLLDAGERVNQSNQHLAEHLRRIVDTRNVIESRRVQQLSQEIKYFVSQLGNELVPLMTSRQAFYHIEGAPDIELPLERPLFEMITEVTAAERPIPASAHIDDEALSILYETFFIDESKLQENIRRLLMSRPEITLGELVQYYPIRQGIPELVTYVLVAAHETQHRIDQNPVEQITITTVSGEDRQVILPYVVFRRSNLQVDNDHV